MSSLSEVLARARTYWEAKGVSSRMMPLRAERCHDLIKGWDQRVIALDKMGPTVGTALLSSLSKEGLSRKSQGDYYAAFRRALALSGVSTIDWPKAPVAPRRVREPVASGDVTLCIDWLRERCWEQTSALALALLRTGMRVKVEALSPDVIVYGSDHIKVIGKGGHERLIPANNIPTLKCCLEVAQSVPYATHLDRWNKAVTALGIKSKMPTFHAIRHLYATQAYHRSGKNLVAVRDLLGHADIATTAGYIGVDLEELRKAAGA